jgi:hypothetical protein
MTGPHICSVQLVEALCELRGWAGLGRGAAVQCRQVWYPCKAGDGGGGVVQAGWQGHGMLHGPQPQPALAPLAAALPAARAARPA